MYICIYIYICFSNTVDGRNPAPVEVGRLSHYVQGFYIPGGAGFLPYTVSKSILKIAAGPQHLQRLRCSGCPRIGASGLREILAAQPVQELVTDVASW